MIILLYAPCKKLIVERLCLRFGRRYSFCALSGVCGHVAPSLVPLAGVFPLLMMMFLCLALDILCFLRDGNTANANCALPVAVMRLL